MEKENEEKTILTSGLRKSLKGLMQQEVEKMPELMEQLNPKDRLNVTLKLMPYMLPKVESVSLTYGEPEPIYPTDIILTH